MTEAALLRLEDSVAMLAARYAALKKKCSRQQKAIAQLTLKNEQLSAMLRTAESRHTGLLLAAAAAPEARTALRRQLDTAISEIDQLLSRLHE